jgi:hypothetical protein
MEFLLKERETDIHFKVCIVSIYERYENNEWIPMIKIEVEEKEKANVAWYSNDYNENAKENVLSNFFLTQKRQLLVLKNHFI